MRRFFPWFLALLVPLTLPAAPRTAAGQGTAPAQSQADSTAAPAPYLGAPVVFGIDTLFRIRTRLGPFTPEQRAASASERIRKAAGDLVAKFDSAVAVDNGQSTDVLVGDRVLFTVTDADADSANHAMRSALAAERARAVTITIKEREPTAMLRVVLFGAVLTLVATVVFLLALRGLSRLLALGIRRLRSWRGTRIPALRIRRFEIFSSAQITEFLIAIVKVLRVALILVLGYAYISLVFSFFPWTRGLASTLLGWVLAPLTLVGLAFVQFVPKAFFIVVIIVVTRYVLKVIHLVFKGIGSGRLDLPNFPAEWAEPTYKLVRLLVAAFSLVVIFPYLPGSQSDAFKGVSVFLGVLLSLGSTAAIANLVAGIVITYMRPFRVGDRVRIADTTGDVQEKTLLVTRVRTIKNEDITIPNAMVLASHIVNFSSSARHLGLILHTSVSIGYDAPWRQVHELLLAAADATEGIDKDPKPFVLQTSLDDFYVSYEINASTELPNAMAVTYSRLHQNIQDKFNEAGVEIMSPHYGALRDGNDVTIPEAQRPKGYRAPDFRVNVRPPADAPRDSA
jgi:small-conductance mechanosensitive channel